jgi:integrase
MTTLTAAAVARLKPGKTRLEISDAKAPGLHLVIQPTGAKSWALRFRRPDGRAAKLTLGKVDLSDSEQTDEPVLGGALTLRAARELANRIDRDRARGIDVVEVHKAQKERHHTAAQDRARNTFGALLRLFFASYKTKRQERPRRWREDAARLGLRYPMGCDPAQVEPTVLKGLLADTWADKPIADIDPHDVHTVIAEARKFGNEARARKLYAVLSLFFGWLMKQQRLIATSPCAGVWRPGPPPARDRVLTDDELRLFWKACEKIGPPFGQLFRLMLATGVRLREAAGLRLAELNADGTWTLPAERSKNHLPLVLPLNGLARDAIAAVPLLAGDAGLVFTTTGTTPVSGFSVAKRGLDDEMAELAGHPVTPWRLHDLRRTVATRMADIGVAPHIVEAVLNHISGHRAGVAGIYNRAQYAAEKKAALELWSAHVEALVKGETAKVVALRPRQGR